MDRICYIPVKGIDDVIASYFGWKSTKFPPSYRVATLRGMYNEAHKDNPLDTSDLLKAAQTLKDFRKEIAIGNNVAMSNSSTTLYRAYVKLRESFTEEEQFNRVNMLASMFSRWVDRMRAGDPSKSREQYIKGFSKNGESVAGEYSIFELIYNELIDRQSYYMSLGTIEGESKANKINKILSNWASLITFVRIKLRDTEKVRLGGNFNWAEEADETSFGENDLEALHNAPESVRESWHELTIMQSSFATVGKEVRRIISCVPLCKIKNGKIEVQYDDLDHPIMLDPMVVHQTLEEDLRGITDEGSMMKAFFDKNGNLKQDWYAPIVQILKTNNIARTQFFVQYKYVYQNYSTLTPDKSSNNKGLKRWFVKNLNKVENLLGGAFKTRISLGIPVKSSNSVYNKKGKINWENLQNVRSLIKEWLNPGPLKVAKWYTRLPKENKINFLVEVSSALGIPLDAETANTIMGNPVDLKEYLSNLKQALTYGINGNLTKDIIEKLNNKNFSSISDRSYKSLLNAKNSAKGSLQEKIDKLLLIITKNREGLRLERSVKHINAKGDTVTLYADIKPSFMGDWFTTIQSYVKNNNKEGLKKFIESQYLISSYFKDSEGKVLNKWLEELLECCNPEGPDLSETFAAKFDFTRALGTVDLVFNKFTEKLHLIDMLTRFWSDKSVSSVADTALYPVFILGDSNALKYIRAKIYSEDTILDGLYNIWRQEKRRMLLTEAANKILVDGGYKSISNFSQRHLDIERTAEGKITKVKGEYTMLPFLNDPKYAALLGNESEIEVKDAISAYMKDAFIEFKKSLNSLNVLDAKEEKIWNTKTKEFDKVPVYRYLPKHIAASNLDEELKKFYWNTKFATLQQLQLMTIDNAFYGKYNKVTNNVESTSKDEQKRYKGTHAPGTSLSPTALDRENRRFSEDGIERVVYFDDISIDSSKSHPKFYKAVKARLKKASYEKYLDNSLTDGQGYRTLRSYKKVLGMAGQWTDEMEYAFKEIERIKRTYGKGKIPQAELKLISDLAVVFQPTKPIMYGMEVFPINNNDNLLIPVNHKYAEAVIIPELLPPNNKLRAIAYWMDEHVDKEGKPAPIDMICTTKAVKVGCFGSTDISKATNESELFEALNKGYVHKFNYSNYRIQTNVPDHVQSARLFGTQIKKLIMKGVKMDERDDGHYASYIDSEYVNLGGDKGKVKMSGRNLIAFYNSLITSNTIDSFNKFSSIVNSPKKLSEMLMQAVINYERETKDHIFAYGLENNDFLMPLFEAAIEHDSSNLLISLFKKIVNKQSIMGNSLVQVSAMGIDGFEEDGSLGYGIDEENNNILWVECEIPFDLSYIEKDKNGNDRVVSLEYDDYCNEDGTLKLGKSGKSLLEERFPGILDMIAYRIPTERDYSMLNLKVKRFSRKTAGGTIKVSAEGTTIAGFDFDIDKLYLMRREFRLKKKQSIAQISGNISGEIANQVSSEILEFEEYDYSKPPYENTRAARNNMLIHLIQQRLMDPETFEDRYTPGGFPNASKAARVMREIFYGDIAVLKMIANEPDALSILKDLIDNGKVKDPEPEYDPSDPMTIILYNQQNQIAGTLIGIFADQNTNYAFSTLMKKFKLLTPIEFAGHSYSDFLHAPEGVDVDSNVTEPMSASVDAVKEPVLKDLNFNTITADSGAVLLRLGYTLEEVGLLFNQPIIKEVCKYCFNNEVGIDIAIRDIITEYLKVPGVKSPKNTNIKPTTNQLAQYILKDRIMKEGGTALDPEFINKQLEILELFNKISTIADEVSKFVTNTKFTASNAISSNFGDLYAQQMRVNKYIKEAGASKLISMEVTERIFTPINNDTELLLMNDEKYYNSLLDNPFAYEQAMFDSIRKALKLFSKYYPYDNKCYTKARSILANLTKSETLDGKTINSIHSDLLVYLLSNQEFSYFNGELPKLGTGHTNPDGTAPTHREYYTKFFAQDLFEELEQNPDLKNLAIFKYMIFDSDDQDVISMTIQNTGGLKPYQKDEIINSWASLNKTHPLIARDLFLYCFYKTGFQFGHSSFMNLTPTEVKQSIMITDNTGNQISYIDFLRKVLNDDIQYNASEFAIQYILNHSDNSRLVFDANKSKVARNILSKAAFNEANEALSTFSIDIADNENASIFVLRGTKIGEDTILEFRPVISYKGALFVAQSGNVEFNKTLGTSMTYVRVEQLGSNGISMNYNTGQPIKRVPDIKEPDIPSGNSEQDPGDLNPVEFDKEATILKIATELEKAYKKYNIRDEVGESITVNGLVEALKEASEEELKAMIEEIRTACREDGILLIDSEGNLLQGC